MAKILLADDSGTAQRMGAQILSAEGHEVSTVSNGQAAIKMLKDFSPDLIVADVFMPGKTGYELCEFVKSDPKSSWIPVLLIVAPMEPYDETEGKRVKADGLVTKPLDKSNLVETVQALLASTKKSKKRGAAKAAAVEEPAPAPQTQTPPEPAEMAETSAAEDPTLPPITTTVRDRLDIPEEIRDQPVSMMSDLLEPQAVEEPVAVEPSEPELPEVEPLVEEGAADELPRVEIVSPQSEPDAPAMDPLYVSGTEPVDLDRDPLLVSGAEPVVPEGGLLSVTESESGEPADEPAEPTAMERLFAAAESSPEETPGGGEPEAVLPTVASQEVEPLSGPTWTAESAAVTAEDRKLFRPDPPDWQGLVEMVQEVDQQGQFPAVSSAVAGSGSSAKPSPSPNSPGEPEPPSPQSPAKPEDQPRSTEAAETATPAPAAKRPPSPNDSIAMSAPRVAPLDHATVEQIVRETVEEVMPQIVERIAQATGLRFQKKDSTKE